MMSSLEPLTAISSLSTLIVDPLPPETRQRVLRLPLGPQDSGLLALEQITEILQIEVAEVLPVPDMPSCVMGICNWRGEMLWLVDFNDLVGYPSPWPTQQSSTPITVIVVQVNHQAVGLGVPQVNDIELHNLQRLQPLTLGLFPPQLLPLAQGMVPEGSAVVLDLQPIVDYPLWKKHPGGEI